VNALGRLPEGLDSAICLSTAFFVIQPRPETRIMEESLLTLGALAVFLFPAGLIFWFLTQLLSFSGLTARIVWVSTILTVLLVGGYLALCFGDNLKISRVELVYERLLASSTNRSLVSSKMLLMRSPRDEATLSLGVITFANWLIDQTRTILFVPQARLARYLFKSQIVSSLIFMAFLAAMYHFRNSPIDMYIGVSWGLVGTILGFIFLLSHALLSFGFGMDVFLGVWRVRISVEACPPGLWLTYVLSPGDRDSSMRHSQPYHSPEAITAIVSWLGHDHGNPPPEWLQTLLNQPATTTN
jgi:hypothetical protein